MDMPMRSTIPDWLTPVAWIYITLSLLSAVFITFDIYARRRRHAGLASELVWITSALYLGPFAIPLYLRRGRAHPSSGLNVPAGTKQSPALAVLPGGGASAVAHLIAVPFVVAVGWTIAGLAMWAMVVVILILVTVMLAIYERVASRSPRNGRAATISVRSAITAALVTVVAFDIGMVGWMLILHINDLMPQVTAGSFWFLMQIGIIIGLLTGYPAVRWLLSRNQTIAPV